MISVLPGAFALAPSRCVRGFLCDSSRCVAIGLRRRRLAQDRPDLQEISRVQTANSPLHPLFECAHRQSSGSSRHPGIGLMAARVALARSAGGRGRGPHAARKQALCGNNSPANLRQDGCRVQLTDGYGKAVRLRRTGETQPPRKCSHWCDSPHFCPPCSCGKTLQLESRDYRKNGTSTTKKEGLRRIQPKISLPE